MLWDQDYMFLPQLKVVSEHQYSQLQIIPNCGHVVNVEHPHAFNQLSLGFLQRL